MRRTRSQTKAFEQVENAILFLISLLLDEAQETENKPRHKRNVKKGEGQRRLGRIAKFKKWVILAHIGGQY